MRSSSLRAALSLRAELSLLRAAVVEGSWCFMGSGCCEELGWLLFLIGIDSDRRRANAMLHVRFEHRFSVAARSRKLRFDCLDRHPHGGGNVDVTHPFELRK